MKKILVFSALAIAAASAMAQQGPNGNGAPPEMGRVISSTPIVQQVAMPQQVCNNQQVVSQAPNSGAGAVLGAIAGGVLGNAIGHGGGRAAATALGVVGGAALGNNAEGPGGTYVQNVPSCYTQNSYENRTVGYNVTYEYAGHRYTEQLANDPGSWVPVQVGAAADTAAQQPVYAQPGTVVSGYSAPPVVYAPAPAYYAPGYYGGPPVGLTIGVGGYYGGHGRWR